MCNMKTICLLLCSSVGTHWRNCQNKTLANIIRVHSEHCMVLNTKGFSLSQIRTKYPDVVQPGIGWWHTVSGLEAARAGNVHSPPARLSFS